MIRTAWLALSLCALVPDSGAAADAAEGTVLVTTQAPRRGQFDETLTAYGAAARSIAGGITVSVPAEGRVLRIAVVPGDEVRTGETLLEFGLSAAAASNHAQAVSALEVARQDRARLQRLLEQQLATADQLSRADKALGDAQAALAALEAEGAAASRQLLAAPFDGVVEAVLAAQGDRVQPGVPLLSLARGKGVVVAIGIEPSERGRLKRGQTVLLEPLTGDAPPFTGTLERVGNLINPKTRLIDAEVAVPHPLLLGESFRARIRTGKLSGWLVPRDAVLDDGGGDHLFQAAAGKAVRVPVRRLGGDDETSVVDGTIDPGQPIVITGNYQLSDGAPLREADAATGAARPAPGAGAAEKRIP